MTFQNLNSKPPKIPPFHFNSRLLDEMSSICPSNAPLMKAFPPKKGKFFSTPTLTLLLTDVAKISVHKWKKQLTDFIAGSFFGAIE
jgi:hypothetical protein